MRLLLDSHTVLWWLDDDGPLDIDVRARIDDVYNDVAVSVATMWELAIKEAAGRLRVPKNLPALLDAQEVEVLPIDVRDVVAAAALPRHHGDPFDRILIAQAQLDDYTVVTADRMFSSYGVATLSAR